MELLQSILGSVVRHALTGVGLVLVSKGWVTAGDWELLLAGTISTAAGLIWSFFQKWKAGQGSSGSGGGGAFASIIGLMIIIPLLGSSIACAKKNGNETPSEAKARKTAVYSAQVVTAFDVLHNLTAVLEDNSVTSPEAAKSIYKFDETGLTSFDTLRARLKDGLPSDALDKIDAILNDVEKLEKDLNAISDPNAKAKFAEAIFTVRFTLNSVRAVIAAKQEPSFTDMRIVAKGSARARAAQPAWWTDAILVIQNGLIRAIEQSRMGTDQAWADADALSLQVHAKNKARIG